MTDYAHRRENELGLRIAQLEARLREAQADRYRDSGDPVLAAAAQRIADLVVENIGLRQSLERARAIAVTLEQECAACPGPAHGRAFGD